LVRLAARAATPSFAISPDPANWGLATPVCAPTCKNMGVCVRTNLCDCALSTYTGPQCDSAPLSCGDNVVQADSGEECDGGACCTEVCRFKAAAAVCRASVGSCDVAEGAPSCSARCSKRFYFFCSFSLRRRQRAVSRRRGGGRRPRV